MKVLLDENLDWRLGRYLSGHNVESVSRIGWAGVANGELITCAESQFDVFITMDVGLAGDLKIANHAIAVILLRARSNRLADTHPLMPKVLAMLETIQPNTVIIIE